MWVLSREFFKYNLILMQLNKWLENLDTEGVTFRS